MPTRLRRRVRRLRRLLVYGVAGLVILAGLLVALASQLLPLVQQQPRELAAWLSERTGQPIAFDASEAEWTRRGPLFVLDGLRVGGGESALDIGRAELLVNVYAGLLPGRPLTELRLRGVALEVSRDSQGRWQVAGIGASTARGDQRLQQLEGLGEVQFENARVRVVDARSGRDFELDRVDARIRARGGRVHVGAIARHGEGQALTLAADMDPGLADGRAWVGGSRLALHQWLEDLGWHGVALQQGHGALQMWLQVADRRVVEAQFEAALRDLSLRGVQAMPDGDATSEPLLGLARLELSARWRLRADGWELSVPRLVLEDSDDSDGNGGEEGGGERLWIARSGQGDASHWQAQAASIGLAAPLALAALASALPPSQRQRLHQAAPRGRLRDLRLSCVAASCEAQADLDGVAWSRVGRMPGVSGLDARIDLAPGSALLRLHSPQLVLDARPTLPGTLDLGLAGLVHAQREAEGWRIGSDALEVAGRDFAATAAGSALLEPGGGRPRLDLFVDIADTEVAAASRFWVDRMPRRAVQWLDEALLAGRVTGASAVLQGDLDDWPFTDDSGVFDAQATLQDVVLDYRPGEWPRAENLNGNVRFRNAGMEASLAGGSVAGVAVARAEGRIERFKEPVLELEAEGEGSGTALMDLLRASPLKERYGEHLQGVTVGGSAKVDLYLLLSLKRELGEPRVLGTATLADADLADARFGLAFEGATGRVRFGSGGFAAEELRVRVQQHPATLSLAVGGYTSDPALAAEATLRGRLPPEALLAHAPAVDWLAPYLDGSSDWQLLLMVPEDGGADARVLRLASDLVGTALRLPAPLRKSAEAHLPLQLEARLPLGQGGISLSLGELLELEGVLPDAGGFNGVAAFGAVEVPAPPARGLRVVGSVPTLDAAGWLGVAAARTGTARPGDLLVDSVDLVAGQLDLAGRRFADTRLSMHDEDGDTRVGLAGAAVDGNLLLPGRNAAQRGITARFERLYLPGADPVEAGGEPGMAAQLLASLDPADIPTLHAWAGDFRFGAAELGETRLETWPTAEGMHVQLFEARSSALELRASGDWTRSADGERSRFQVGFTAEHLGEMLEALGFARMVEGGQTLARLDATWPGAPSAFSLERLDGRLSLSVGQGSVPDVKPGAGRILGLLSLSEIPRRLSLDFSDFFTQGFSFNTIQGDFVLDAGSAYTDNLVIDAAAAEIRVFGRTGLADRSYDQTLEVTPRTSGVLPVVGAIAGGPAGAAIGAVAQAVLQRPMKDMTRAVYRVEGSWDEPRITLVPPVADQ